MATSILLTDSPAAALAATDTGPTVAAGDLHTAAVTAADTGATLTLEDLP